jgi:hypothetical protein
VRRLPHVVALVACFVVAAPASAQEEGKQAVVTGAVQVTSNPNPVRAHATPLIARNPKNGELVVAEVDVRGSRNCAVNVSTDDGRSWSQGAVFTSNPSRTARSAPSTGPTSCRSSMKTEFCTW